jgi:hypothetical protein
MKNIKNNPKPAAKKPAAKTTGAKAMSYSEKKAAVKVANTYPNMATYAKAAKAAGSATKVKPYSAKTVKKAS